jgi:hypothetical protein
MMKERVLEVMGDTPHTIQWIAKRTNSPALAVAKYLTILVDEGKVQVLHFSAQRRVYKRVAR